MKIIEKERDNKTFKSLKVTDIFKMEGSNGVYIRIAVKTILNVGPVNCLGLTTGCHGFIEDDHKVTLFKNAELHLG